MLYGVFSDVHSNLEALEAVLRFFDELEVTEIARVTGLSERTVARRLRDAVGSARGMLEGSR